MNIEATREALTKGIKRYCENIRPLNLNGIATPSTLTLGDRIQTFSYYCVTTPTKYYQFIGEYYWTVMQMSLQEKTEKDQDIIACFLYHRQKDTELTFGQKLKEVCVIVPKLPFCGGVYTRTNLETVLHDASYHLRLIADFTDKVNTILST